MPIFPYAYFPHLAAERAAVLVDYEGRAAVPCPEEPC